MSWNGPLRLLFDLAGIYEMGSSLFDHVAAWFTLPNIFSSFCFSMTSAVGQSFGEGQGAFPTAFAPQSLAGHEIAESQADRTGQMNYGPLASLVQVEDALLRPKPVRKSVEWWSSSVDPMKISSFVAQEA
jgi:hypothetical protein